MTTPKHETTKGALRSLAKQSPFDTSLASDALEYIGQLEDERDEYYEGYRQLMNRNAEYINDSSRQGARIKMLESLCRDLWLYGMRPQHGGADGKELHDRMQFLGLLEEE